MNHEPLTRAWPYRPPGLVIFQLTLNLPGAHDDLVQGAAQSGQLGHPGLRMRRVSSEGQRQAQAEQQQGPHHGDKSEQTGTVDRNKMRLSVERIYIYILSFIIKAKNI